MTAEKSATAFRTISEVAEWLGTPTHVLRFWESKFSQVKPVKRAGGRRYYRPADMQLLGGIKKLLHEDGMTIKGAQKILRENGVRYVVAMSQPLDDDLERFVEPLTPGKDAVLMKDAPGVPDHEVPDLSKLKGDDVALPAETSSAPGHPPATPQHRSPAPRDDLRGTNPAAEPTPERAGSQAKPKQEIGQPKGPSAAAAAAVKSGRGLHAEEPKPTPAARPAPAETAKADGAATGTDTKAPAVAGTDTVTGTATPGAEATKAAAEPDAPAAASTPPQTASEAAPGFQRSTSPRTGDAPEDAAEDASETVPSRAPQKSAPLDPAKAETPARDAATPAAAPASPAEPTAAPARPAGRRLSLSVAPEAEAPEPDALPDAETGDRTDEPARRDPRRGTSGLWSIVRKSEDGAVPSEALAPIVARLAALRDKMAQAGPR